MNFPVLSSGNVVIPQSVLEGTYLEQYFQLPDQGEKLREIFEQFTRTQKAIRLFSEHLFDPDAIPAKHYMLVGPVATATEALSSLKVDSWSEAFRLTGVQDVMCQEDRQKWNDALKSEDVPDFTPSIVMETLNGMLQSRGEIFARRVESVFKSLSRKHVTNPAHAFGSKLIIRYANIYSGGYISTDHSQIGYIHDLRYLVATFMGTEVPRFSSTYSFFNHLLDTKKFGEFYDFDLGAFSVKIHKNGSCHIKIHPDLAWRLNAILASLYGAALPEKFKNTASSYSSAAYIAFADSAISSECIIALEEMEYDRIYDKDSFDHSYKRVPNSCVIGYRGELPKATQKEIDHILTTCGGVVNIESKAFKAYKFDYDFLATVRYDLISSRTIPESVSYQFYPTPQVLGQEVVDRAQIESHHSVLEPEAGNGDMADLIPSKNLTCVELCELRVNILKAKGHITHKADFLEWSKDHHGEFDRILSNPPYRKNQALRHVQASFDCLKPGGIMTAILPPTLKDKIKLDNSIVIWSDSIPKAFKNTGITVRIVTIIKGI